jgi:hypothetical protein
MDSFCGERLSPPVDLTEVGVVSSSVVEWTATEPEGTSITISAGLSTSDTVEPTTWVVCTSGEEIPGIVGEVGGGQYLWVKQAMTTDDPAVTPALHTLTVTINGKSYVQTGRAFQRLFRGIVGGWDLSGDSTARITLTNEMVLWNKEPLRIQSTSCPWSYKGTECGYTGPMGPCDKSYEACQLRGNEANFGGDRFLAAAMLKQVWWGRTRNYPGK